MRQARRPSPFSASVDPEDIARFEAESRAWWDTEGPFRLLHAMNPLRLAYIRHQIGAIMPPPSTPSQPYAGLTWLDVGCGGGLLTEALAREGAAITGLDASEGAVRAAEAHARATGLANALNLQYRVGSAEDLLHEDKGPFDVITALEVLEHVADRGAFLAALGRLVRPGGLLIIATLNRTPQSLIKAVWTAEYALRLVPPGTHTWRSFVRPSELVRALETEGFTARHLTGWTYSPWTGAFALTPRKTDVNYFLTAQKG